MIDRRFSVDLPVDGDDETAQLGRSLLELGNALQRTFQETETLAKVTERINAGLTLDEVLDLVFESFRPIIPYERIGFSLLEEDGTIVKERWARTDAEEIVLPHGYQCPLERTSLGEIIRRGTPRIINDLEAYLREHPGSETTKMIVQEGMRSSLTCPLIAMGKPIGFMFFDSAQRNAYREVHTGLFQQIAGQLSMIVEKGRLYQRLVELDEVKNRFLGIAAHDLRSPITVFKGFLAILLRGVLGDVAQEQKDVMQRMSRACEGMLALINDLLDVSAIQSGKLTLEKQEVDLAAFLRELHETTALLAKEKAIEMRLETEPGMPRVSLDRNRISQVINNLVTNAIKFSNPRTVVILSARRDGDRVLVAVADQGPGIPPGEIPNLFAEFTKTSVKPTAGEKSTGLGLAIVKRLVEAHDGEVWAESRLGEGSTFKFTLPLAPGS